MGYSSLKSLKMALFYRIYTVLFLLVCHCNYSFMLYHFRTLTGRFALDKCDLKIWFAQVTKNGAVL